MHHQLPGTAIMRAADCMLGVCRNMLPAVAVGKVLIQRDEATALPSLLYAKLPLRLDGRPLLLLDPMLATGGSAVAALSRCLTLTLTLTLTCSIRCSPRETAPSPP